MAILLKPRVEKDPEAKLRGVVEPNRVVYIERCDMNLHIGSFTNGQPVLSKYSFTKSNETLKRHLKKGFREYLVQFLNFSN